MNAFPHLRFTREPTVNFRRSKGFPRFKLPEDIPAHAQGLKTSLNEAISQNSNTIGGFDERLLFKLDLQAQVDQIESIPGVELISEEDGGYSLVFADQNAMGEFEARLSTLATGGKPTRAQIFYALKAFDYWSSEDRSGWALKRNGLPAREVFLIDIELWPVPNRNEREALINSFTAWSAENGIETKDKIIKEGLIAFRLKIDQTQTELLLNHRDVRTVDLLPDIRMEIVTRSLDIQNIGRVPSPPNDAPFIAVLDSGIATNHPLLGPAIGDAQGFMLPDRNSHDDNGHGTHVAGIALYDDVEYCAQNRQFIPQIRLLSGRIFNEQAEADPRFIENIIDEAVRYFHDNYDCRIFNLSYGDFNKPYFGGRISGLAYTLDCLSRELDILFVVPTGNLRDDQLPDNVRNEYPNYLLNDNARLLDPAPAVNCITVGSVARYEQSNRAGRYPNDLVDIPISLKDQISPFSRCGSSVKGTIKPELVAYGGNTAINPRDNILTNHLLGELSTNKDFIGARLLGDRVGTSFAVPHIAHLAARLLGVFPEASANLIRAILISHAKQPSACKGLFNKKELHAKTIGYGMVDDSDLYRSTEENVTIFAEAAISNDQNQFYEIPIPDSLYTVGKRRREITITLAYSPVVRTTRIDYKGTRMQFRLLEAEDIASVTQSVDKLTKDQIKSIKELPLTKTYNSSNRDPGTVQSTTWTIIQSRQKKLFVVVTRNDYSWAENYVSDEEPYALVVRISDRENQNARLYTQVQSILQARERARVRI